MKTLVKKKKLDDFFLTEKEHIENIKKKRPELYKLLENPSPKARLAANIYRLRNAHKITQKELADKAGIGLKTFQRIETAQPDSNPTMDAIAALAKSLKVDIQELYEHIEI